MKKCKHNRNADFCCLCRYGDVKKSEIEYQKKHKPKELVDLINERDRLAEEKRTIL